MTKTLFKRAAAAAGLAALLASALPVSAMEPQTELEWNDNSAAARALPVYQNTCAGIANVSTQLQAKLNDLRTQMDARRDERKSTLAGHRAESRDKASDREAEWNARWEKMTADMQADATTDAERAAIAQFKADMQAAFSARKTAVDAANTAFRAGIDKAVDARKAAVQKAADTLKTTIKSLFVKAAADCAAGVPAATVKTALKTGLEAAHAKFRTDMQAVDKVGADAKALAETRNAAIRKAQADFKAAAEKARATLKAALPQTKGAANDTDKTGEQE